ncbi:MAG: ROK family protein [Planctomycetota bacterium]
MNNSPDLNSTPVFAGVDVGGTNIKIGLVDDDGRTIAHTKFPTQQENGPARAIEQASTVIDQLIQQTGINPSDVVGVGLGTPGPMDVAKGLLLTPSNLPAWHNYPIRDELSKATGRPVTYANDAAAAAFGEFWVGAGASHDSIVLITLGTGVGGGIIVNGQSIDGHSSHGAEIGHMVVDYSPDARLCGCGQRGHLEAYASATAVVQRAQEGLAAQRESSLTGEITEASPLSALMIARAAMSGDEFALEIVDDTARWLGRGITILAHVIDPSAFFLGGAMNFGGNDSELGQRFLGIIRTYVRENSFPVLGDNLCVEFARLGGEAGYVGAAGLARQMHVQPVG